MRALVPLPALATLHAFGVRCDPDALLDVVRQLASLRELTFACCVRDRALYERFVRRRVPQITVLDNRPLPAPGDDAPAGERDASDAALLEELRGLVRAGKRVRVASGVQRAAGGADAGE